MLRLHCVTFCCVFQVEIDKVDNKFTNFVQNVSESCLEFLIPKKLFQSHKVHAALLLCHTFECSPQRLTPDNVIKEFTCHFQVPHAPKEDRKAVRVSNFYKFRLAIALHSKLRME